MRQQFPKTEVQDPKLLGFVRLGIRGHKRRRIRRLSVLHRGVLKYFCNRCGRLLPLTGFYSLSAEASRCGLQSECTGCARVRRRQWRAARMGETTAGGETSPAIHGGV